MKILVTNLEALGTPNGPAVFLSKLLGRLPELRALTYRNAFAAPLGDREVNLGAATLFNEICWISPAGWKKLLREVRDADLVHLNLFNGSELCIALLMKALGKKIVSTLHSRIFFPPAAPKVALENLRLLLVFNILLFLADRLVFLTEAHGDNYRRHTFFQKTFADKRRIIPHAIEPDRILARRVAPAAPPAVLYVGRLEERKGAGDLLRLIEAWEGPEVAFTLVGGGNVASARQRLQHRENAHVLGAVDNERLYALYDRANILIVPSHSESFGIVLLEGMARGLALLVSDIPGMREIVREKRNGYFFPPGDTAAMRERILHLEAHPEEVDRLGRNNLEDVRRFSADIQAARYRELYRDALAKAR